MKIGIDISQVVYGTGVANYTLGLINHLPPEIVKTFKFNFPLSPRVMDLLWNRLHVFNVENFAGEIDIYHSSDWTQGPSRAKKVTTVHDLTPFLYPQETDPQIVAVHTRRMKWVVKECDKIICVSQNTANDLIRLFKVSQEKVAVIYEALPERFKLPPQITKYTNYVLAIGSRQPRKNIARLKKACEVLQKKLIIVGEGSELGYVSDQDLVNYLAGASAFVYPSIYEGFGLPILEAFYHKVPVACSNTSSLSEVAGKAAIYFDPFDEDQMAKAITETIKNKEKLVELGTKQLAKFSWEKTATETLKVYESLV